MAAIFGAPAGARNCFGIYNPVAAFTACHGLNTVAPAGRRKQEMANPVTQAKFRRPVGAPT